jgi:hypothetical protein
MNAERMNRTLKEATVKRYDYQTHQQLKEHLFNFLNAYHFAKRLKTLKGLSPYEYIIKCWQKKPQRFRINPNHHTMGLNISLRPLQSEHLRNSTSGYSNKPNSYLNPSLIPE